MASSDEQQDGLLVAYDSMAVPGRPASLVADLLKEGLFAPSPLGGEVLFFEHEGRLLGRTLTGGDGRAVVLFTPRALGRMTVTVRVGESRRVTARETTAGVFVWDRKRPSVVISMKALSSVPLRPDLGLPLPRSGARLRNPDGGAVEALTALAQRVHVMYVTASDRLELSEARLWADRNRLPAGPVFLLKPGPIGLSHELDRWRREGWTNIKGGLAGTGDEAKALVDRNLKAVIPPDAPAKEKWPNKAVAAKDWQDVARQFS